ncbi:MAG: hypothetical protein ACXADL_12690 [Candidatus Thorarchaeota archaeon]|jgi:hypothetical protein
MSVENVSYELENGTFPAPTRTARKVINVEDATGVYPNTAVAILAVIHSSVPTTDAAEAGKYAYGCRLVNTYPTMSTGNINVGTVSVPSWSTVT